MNITIPRFMNITGGAAEGQNKIALQTLRLDLIPNPNPNHDPNPMCDSNPNLTMSPLEVTTKR